MYKFIMGFTLGTLLAGAGAVSAFVYQEPNQMSSYDLEETIERGIAEYISSYRFEDTVGDIVDSCSFYVSDDDVEDGELYSTHVSSSC